MKTRRSALASWAATAYFLAKQTMGSGRRAPGGAALETGFGNGGVIRGEVSPGRNRACRARSWVARQENAPLLVRYGAILCGAGA
jgi:hypothetical protein